MSSSAKFRLGSTIFSEMRRKKLNNGGRERRVGLIFDERMCKHYDPSDKDHPECPDRIKAIWDLLNSSGLAKRCIILKANEAEDNHLALAHTKNHIDLIKNISSKNSNKRKRIAAKFDSIYFNEGSTEAAYLAAGSVIEAAEKVVKGELHSAFAIVRPPGHHAEEGEPMGFCLYNNVGIAASYLLNERIELGIKKILIVDWDVHHGNGTQKMFYKDPRVLLFSVHRYDNGTFYPGGRDGSYIMTGEESGAGHNINVPWSHERCGDADYLAVWDFILIPVAKEFKPDMIFISAGFDAAIGDPLGGCSISPYGYSLMLDKLMEFARGRIVMALEGGYNLKSIASSARACVEVLLHDKPPNVVLEASPFAATWRLIQEVRRELSTYWPVLAVEIPFTPSPESDDSFLALSPGTQERVSLECYYHGVFLAEIKAALEKFPELEKMPKSLVMVGKLMFYFEVRDRDYSTLRDLIKMKSMAHLVKYEALLKDAFSFNTALEAYKRKFSLIRDFITSEQAAQPAATSEDLLIHYGLIKESTWMKPAKQETAQNAVEIAAEKTQDEAAYHQTMNTGWSSQRQLNPTLTRCTQLKSWWSD